MKALVIHGPNLNMLSTRKPEMYGKKTLSEVDKEIHEVGSELGLEVETVQLNGEGEIVGRIQAADFDVLIIHAGAYTHTSIAIRDAIAAVEKPAFEVHISNIHNREEFRRKSYIAGVAMGQISGFGTRVYALALRAAVGMLFEAR